MVKLECQLVFVFKTLTFCFEFLKAFVVQGGLRTFKIRLS